MSTGGLLTMRSGSLEAGLSHQKQSAYRRSNKIEAGARVDEGKRVSLRRTGVGPSRRRIEDRLVGRSRLSCGRINMRGPARAVQLLGAEAIMDGSEGRVAGFLLQLPCCVSNCLPSGRSRSRRTRSGTHAATDSSRML